MGGWRMVASLVSVGAMLAAGLAAAPASPPSDAYQMVALDGLEGGTADAINNRGEVAGTLPADNGLGDCAVAVLWMAGETRTVDVAGTPPCVSVNDLNHHREVVGEYTEGPDFDAYHWRRGETLRLTGFGYFHYANAVSDRGMVAGGYLDEGLAGGPRAMIWQNGVGTDLGTLEVPPGSFEFSESGATGINHKHQVVGWSAAGEGRRHAFLWDRGEMTDLGTLGGMRSEAVGVNHHGAVVGRSTTADGSWRAFLWDNGTMADLGDWTPVAINKFGRIVGNHGGQVVLWHSGGLVTVGPGTATDLNDRGQIVGLSSDGQPVIWQR